MWEYNGRKGESDSHPAPEEALTEALAWEATGKRTPRNVGGAHRRSLCSLLLAPRLWKPECTLPRQGTE